MEGYAKLDVTHESEWDRFGSAAISFQCDSEKGAKPVGDRRKMAGSTSWSFKMPNFDDNFEDFHRLATSPEPTYNFTRRSPGATTSAPWHFLAAVAAARPQAAATHPHAAAMYPLVAAAHPLAAAAQSQSSTTHSQSSTTHSQSSTTRSQSSTTRSLAAAAGSEPPSVSERARAAWTAIANKYSNLEPRDGQTAQQIMGELLQDRTVVGAYLRELVYEYLQSKSRPPPPEGPSAGDKPICKFCRNNFEEDIYHPFKDASGLVVCPVLSKHVCDLCGVSGSFAHTRKYCPTNPLTLGCPQEGGFPPGMLPKDVYDTTQQMLQMINSLNKYT